jgi:hypothetical protein
VPTSSPFAPSTPFATLNGLRVISGSVRVPGVGAWTADVMLDAPPPVALPPTPRAATLVIGDITLTGTVLPDNSGAFAEAGWYRIVGGAGGWASLLASRAYHNDAGIRIGDLLTDAAADAGETLGELPPVLLAILVQGVDYARAGAPASAVLAELLALALGALPGPVAGFAPTWWVELDGTTNVGARPVVPLTPGTAFDLLDYHPDARLLELATDTLGAFVPGVLITDARLTTSLVVREIEIVLGETLRLRCWVDEVDAVTTAAALAGLSRLDNRLVRALRALVRDALPQLRYLPLARYRVVAMTAGRADLQAVDPRRGLPDLQLVRLAPGIAGVEQELAPGGVVLVSFQDGDPSQPIVVSYPPKDDGAFVPVSVSVGSATSPISLAGGADAVALATPISTWAAAVRTALAGATPPITVPPMASPAAEQVTAT